MADIKLLHVYGQDAWHDEVYIIGNRAGLESLLNTIIRAIETGVDSTPSCDESDPVFVSDGEGFTTVVFCDESDWQGEFWRNLAMPYNNDYAQGSWEKIKPWELWYNENRKNVLPNNK